jgi:hypothetical protein
MRWERVFLDDDTLRPIWRFSLCLALIFAAYFVTMMIAGGASRSVSLFRLYLLFLAALLGIFKLMTAVFDRKPLGAVGLAFHGRWGRELSLGLGLGAAMILAVAFLEWIMGLGSFAWGRLSSASALEEVGYYGAFLGLAAANEELLFRGYPFQRLVESIGPLGAVGLSSAIFGIAHLANPGHTSISTANTVLVGIPLAVAYLRTRALWMPIAIHFSWNFTQGPVLGLPVSGYHLPGLFRPGVSGAAWLTGAAYGPEGGLLATGVIVAATGYLLVSERIHMSEEMRAMLFGPACSRPSPGIIESSSPASADQACLPARRAKVV